MLSDNEIWEKVKEIKGITLETYTHNSPNKILDIINDEILIENRSTRPSKEDVITAYKLLLSSGELERKRDLLELTHQSKQTSSIVFRIVGELAKSEISVIKRKNVVVLQLHSKTRW